MTITWETEEYLHDSARRIPDSPFELALFQHRQFDRGCFGCTELGKIGLDRAKCVSDCPKERGWDLTELHGSCSIFLEFQNGIKLYNKAS